MLSAFLMRINLAMIVDTTLLLGVRRPDAALLSMTLDRGQSGAGRRTPRKMSLAEEKLRAREQWGQDPCGASTTVNTNSARASFSIVERHRYQEYAPWMPRLMEFEKFRGARLLEIGCGMGTDLLQFARGGARCTGIDLTPRSIEITRHRFRLYGADGNFMISDGERLPFRTESFDVVYSNGVLHHTPDTAGAIREVHRVLRPGGIAKVMLYHRNSLNYWFEIVLRRGVLGFEFLRGRSAEEIMSRVIEFSDHDARPLVKVYSRNRRERCSVCLRMSELMSSS